jgi:hypothetical protein
MAEIIKRDKNVFLVRVFLGRDLTGKILYHNKTIHGTQKDAQQWLCAIARGPDNASPIALHYS